MNPIIYFSSCCFIFLVILAINYFSKKRLDNQDNKTFAFMIVILIITLFFEIVGTFLPYEHFQVIKIIFKKIYLICYLLWIILFVIFSINLGEVIKKYQKLFLIITGTIIGLIIIILPIKYNVNADGVVVNVYGTSLNVFIGSLFVYAFFILFYSIKFSKKAGQKRYPTYVFVVLLIITGIIQIIFPQILILTLSSSIVTLLMFLTIENPDMKLIEQLNVEKDRADRANSAKTDFLSSMSHEIRTPLNAIVGFSQSLKEEELSESAMDEVNDIIMASESLVELVNGILDISKIEANKLEIINSEYSFRKTFNELVALTRARMGDKPLDFRFKCDGAMPEVLYGDHTRLKQIILNLLTNAVKYTKEGYVSFNVSSVVTGDVCRLIISVQDSGIGIKKENIDKLFTKFERLDVEKNTTIEGTGLGLAITKKLVELMNGKIVVQSDYGVGSKFTVAIDQRVVLGKQADDVLQKTQTIDLTSINIASKKVMIVDDNSLNLKVASRLLKKYNVIITECNSGFECLEKINNGETCDLILLDDMMPKMSGVETLKHLREIANFNIPVVVLTANAISGMREKYIDTDGFDDYLAKPIELPELNRIIKKYLQNK